MISIAVIFWGFVSLMVFGPGGLIGYVILMHILWFLLKGATS